MTLYVSLRFIKKCNFGDFDLDIKMTSLVFILYRIQVCDSVVCPFSDLLLHIYSNCSVHTKLQTICNVSEILANTVLQNFNLEYKARD